MNTAFNDLGDLLHGIYLLREASARPLDPSTAGNSVGADATGANTTGLTSLDAMVDACRPDVFVDVTASADVAAAYDRVLESGGSVVTANKLRL